MTDLEKRVLELSYKNKLSHIGSCLTAVGLIDAIYSAKKKDEPFILSGGHAHIAHLVVMEKHGKKIGKIHDIHCNFKDGCDVPTGSLGQGLPIAVGMALADRSKNVYVLLTDGECAEGSIWEALRIAADLRLENLRITVNANGYSALGKLDVDWLDLRLQYFYPTLVIKTNLFKYPDWLQGVMAHYKVMTKEEYDEVSSL